MQLTGSREAVEQIQATVNGMAQRLLSLHARLCFRERPGRAGADLCQFLGAVVPEPAITDQRTIGGAGERFTPDRNADAATGGDGRKPNRRAGLLATLQSAVGQVESQVTAAEQGIEGLYNQFNNQLDAANRHLEEIEYLLTQLAEASFQLLPTEAGIAAVKAAWCKSSKEQKGDPQGVLYLTDQRLIFEQKEEIATKKVLFVVTEKQKVQGLQLESPVALADKVETSKQGLLKNEDHIEIHFASGAPLQMAHFHIWQEAAGLAGADQPCQNQGFRSRPRGSARPGSSGEGKGGSGAVPLLRRKYHHSGPAWYGQHQMRELWICDQAVMIEKQIQSMAFFRWSNSLK